MNETTGTAQPADAGQVDRPVGRPVPGRREDGMPVSADERHLRRLLAVRVAMPHTYYDDGEAQGQEHGIVIDFMREPVADIDAKLCALNVARLYVAQKPIPHDIAKVLADNLWDLYAEDGDDSTSPNTNITSASGKAAGGRRNERT